MADSDHDTYHTRNASGSPTITQNVFVVNILTTDTTEDANKPLLGTVLGSTIVNLTIGLTGLAFGAIEYISQGNGPRTIYKLAYLGAFGSITIVATTTILIAYELGWWHKSIRRSV